MGSYMSRSRGDVQEVDISANAAYRYPPKTGTYFGSHFIMGGQKFETMQPEAYLFGENTDLNFLGIKPYNAPYKVSSPSQPIKALRCLVNIRKDSLRLVKVPCSSIKTGTNDGENVEQDRQITTEDGEGPFQYNIEFTFDADCPCSITIYYNATEEMLNKNVIYSPDPARDCSDTVHFNSGCNQQFCLPSHCIDPAKLAVSTVDWAKGYTKIPIVIQICADCGPTVVGHSHITYAEFYKPSDNTLSIRTVKQKQAIDGVCYLIQEIFGIENKNTAKGNEDDDDGDDSEDDSQDCVVCLSETRDTLILPCKHLCLCSTCANQLRYQQSGCPICRQSFRALLQIRAVRKKVPGSSAQQPTRRQTADSNDEEDEVEVVVPVPTGYEVVPLIEAIKGNVSSNPTKKQTKRETAVSPSVDEVIVVDETTATSSASPSSRAIIPEEVTIVSDRSDDEIEIKPLPAVIYENDVLQPGLPERTGSDQIFLSGPDVDDCLYEDILSQADKEIQLPGMEDGQVTDSAESKNSSKELLPETEIQARTTETATEKSGLQIVGEPVEV